MKELGRIKGKNGKSLKVIYEDTDKGIYLINEFDKDDKVIKTVTLNQEEIRRLHVAMSKIENY